MKKLITTFSFILFTIPVFATDIRQVMFGNNYETIKEISEKEISAAGRFSYFLIFSAHCAMITKT